MGNHRFTISGQWEKIRRGWTQRGSFQQEISSLGVLNFNGKYIGKKLILYFNRKLQVKLEVGVSGFMDILISNTYLSGKIPEEAELNGKEGVTRGSFQWKITILGTLN